MTLDPVIWVWISQISPSLQASRGRYQHIHFNTGLERQRGIDEVEEVLHSVQFKFRDPFRGCLGPDYLAIRNDQASDAEFWSRMGDVADDVRIVLREVSCS